MRAQSGFSLVEVAVVAAIMAIVCAVVAATLASKPGSAAAAGRAFDGAYAQALAVAATSGDGATLVFRPAPAGGQAFQLQLYAGRPDGSATPAPSGPPADFDASVTGTTLGAPPFSIFVTSAGFPSGAASYPPASGALEPIATEPACPAGGYRLRLQAGASSAERILPAASFAEGASWPSGL